MVSQSRVRQIPPKESRGLDGLVPDIRLGQQNEFSERGTGEDTVYPNDQLLVLHLLMNSLCEERPQLMLAEFSYELIIDI